MTTIHHSVSPDASRFAIYEDPEDQEPPSPSEVYEGDTSFGSESSHFGAEAVLPSIENEPEVYNDSYTRRPYPGSARSRRVSGVTTTSFVSSLPSEMSVGSKPVFHGIDAKYTPLKERPPFRNPSSVRAMQMSSPPPFVGFESPRERAKGSYKLATPSRSGRSETPVSARRSGSHRSSQYREQRVQQSPRPTPTPQHQQHLPLVLLHVTILPMQVPYSHEVISKAMPQWLVENYKLLAEKLEDLVLMQRGLLIPHPNEEYDVLEERILESLELKTPRLLKCGHFVGPEGDTEDDGNDESGKAHDGEDGRDSRMSGGTITVEDEGDWVDTGATCDDANLCTDCHRPVKRPGTGIGEGMKKWDIKIYAANGLMRAGAWSAAWREMERCDVEIAPWIPIDVRKSLEAKMEEEKEAERRKMMHEAEVYRRVEEETVRLKQLEIEAEEKRRREAEELRTKSEANEDDKQKKAGEFEAMKTEFDEALNKNVEQAKEVIRLEFEARLRLLEEKLKRSQAPRQTPNPTPLDNQPTRPSHSRQRSTSRRPTPDEIPLSTLLRNYILLLARDSRNIIIVILGTFVAVLVTYNNPNRHTPLPAQHLAELYPSTSTIVAPSPVYFSKIYTETLVSTSVVTATVTQVERYSAVPQPSLAPVDNDKPDVVESLSASEDTTAPTISRPQTSTEDPQARSTSEANTAPTSPFQYPAFEYGLCPAPHMTP